MFIVLIIIINSMLMVVLAGLKPIMSLHAAHLGVSAALISIMVAAYPFFPMLMSVTIGKWVDKYGIRRMLILGSIGFIFALSLSIVFPVFWVMVLQQALIGVMFSFYMLALQKRVGTLKGNLDRTIANYSMTGSLGHMVGPLISTPVYEYFGFRATLLLEIAFIAAALIMILSVNRSLWSVDAEAEEKIRRSSGEGASGETSRDENRASAWKLLREQRDLRNAILISGLVLSNRELFTAYFPLLGHHMGISPTAIGVFLSINGMMALIIRLSQAALVERFGRLEVLMWSLYFSGLAYVLIPFTPWFVPLAIFVGVLGGGLGLGQPLSLSYTILVSPPERRGEMLGMRITVNRAAQFAIPVVFGGVGGLLGVSVIFVATGAVLLLFGYLTRPHPSGRGERAPERGKAGRDG